MHRGVRLASFNILEGLRPLAGIAGERRALDRDRAAAAKTVIAELAPDILVLNEALFCRAHEGRQVDYAALFGFAHEFAALYDGAWGNAILSRYPIVAREEYRIHDRGGLIATVDAPGGRVAIASYHPHPDRLPQDKARDLSAMVSRTAGPLLLCGDLNCINPEDSPDLAGLIAAFAAFSPEPERAVKRFIDGGEAVFASLQAWGLRDAVPLGGRRYSIPTDLINADKRSGMRIDHILANGAVEVIAGEVAHSAASNAASDHHPVVVEFRLKPGAP